MTKTKTYFTRVYQDLSDPETYIYTPDMALEDTFFAAEAFIKHGFPKAEMCERSAGGTIRVSATFLRDDPERDRIERVEAAYFGPRADA